MSLKYIGLDTINLYSKRSLDPVSKKQENTLYFMCIYLWNFISFVHFTKWELGIEQKLCLIKDEARC